MSILINHRTGTAARWLVPLFPLFLGCSAGGNGTGPVVNGSSGGSINGAGATFGAGGNCTDPSCGQNAGGYSSSNGGSGNTQNGNGGQSVAVGGPDAGPYPYSLSVQFNWPESTNSGTCKAGLYSGSFSGLYSSGLTFVGVPIPVAGNLSLTLAQSANGEFFTITGGKLCGLADGLFPFSAVVTGTLDCAKGELENGQLTHGGYWLGVVIGPPAGTFNGPMPATYDKLTHSFTGTWKVYEPKMETPEPIFGGNGPWNASLGAVAGSTAGCVADAGAP